MSEHSQHDHPPTSKPASEERFVAEIRRQTARAGHEQRLTFWQGLSMVGAVGWMVALPSVLAAWLGHWLDHHYRTGALWTLALLLLGVALGCLSVWRHLNQETKP